MLEIVDKDGNVNGCDFPRRMVELQNETIVKIIELTREYTINPFEAIKIFGGQLVQAGAEMQAQYEIKQNKEDNKGGNE